MSGHGSEWGSGEGKGGGKGGTIRDAGGSFGKMQAVHEEEYFRKLEQERLKSLKTELSKEIKNHEDEISKHKAAIERHKDRIEEIQDVVKKND